jgi:hypothetical protein
MLTEEQLSERLRAGLHRELAAIKPPDDLLGRLRKETAEERALGGSLSDPDESTRRRLSSGFSVSRRLRSVGGVISLAASVLVVAVVAGALLVGAGHRRSVGTAAGSPGQQLLGTLGILRKRATVSDRRLMACAKSLTVHPTPLARSCSRELPLPLFLWKPASGGGNRAKNVVAAQTGYPKLDLALLRAVELPRWGGVVTILPSTFQPAPTSSQRSEGLIATLAIRGGDGGSGPYPPMNVAALRAHGLSLFAPIGNRMSRGFVIVPDGVAKVELGPFKLRPGEGKFSLRGIASVTANVHDNVAWLQVNTPTIIAPSPTRFVVGAGMIQATAQMTWLDPRGTTVARTTTDVRLAVMYRGRRRR